MGLEVPRALAAWGALEDLKVVFDLRQIAQLERGLDPLEEGLLDRIGGEAQRAADTEGLLGVAKGFPGVSFCPEDRGAGRVRARPLLDVVAGSGPA